MKVEWWDARRCECDTFSNNWLTIYAQGLIFESLTKLQKPDSANKGKKYIWRKEGADNVPQICVWCLTALRPVRGSYQHCAAGLFRGLCIAYWTVFYFSAHLGLKSRCHYPEAACVSPSLITCADLAAVQGIFAGLALLDGSRLSPGHHHSLCAINRCTFKTRARGRLAEIVR
jgi:hypothetical protein